MGKSNLMSMIDLNRLDSKIDSKISSIELLKVSKDIALIHALWYFEDTNRLYGPNLAKKHGFEEYKVWSKLNQDGLDFLVQWICKFCPIRTEQFLLDVKSDTYVMAKDATDLAIDYSDVWDFMNLIRRKRATAKYVDGDVIRIEYTGQIVPNMEIVDKFLSPPEGPDELKLIKNNIGFDVDNLLRNITIIEPKGNRFRYVVNDIYFNRRYLENVTSTKHLWELDDEWDFDGYTVREFRRFWITIYTLCQIHNYACMTSGLNGGALNSTIRIMSERIWIETICHRSSLDSGVVERILSTLIYDIDLYSEGMKHPDVLYQPFFRFENGNIGLSNWIVLTSNPERNHWDLLSILKPDIHSKLRNAKEKLWILHLCVKLVSQGFKCVKNFKFEFETKSSEVDLIVIDCAKKNVLLIQMKWLTAPDRIKDVFYTEKELQIGLDQAALSLKWFKSSWRNLEFVKSLKLEEYDLQVNAIVLSKNTVGSGWVYNYDIPILNERLFKWLLFDPYHLGLFEMYMVAKERRFMPKENVHYESVQQKVEFFDVKFEHDFGMKFLHDWDPKTDIDLSGIK